jgi:hypothetical protein
MLSCSTGQTRGLAGHSGAWQASSFPPLLIFVDKGRKLCSNEGVEGNLKPGDLVRWQVSDTSTEHRRGFLDIITSVQWGGFYVTVLSCGGKKLYSMTRFKKIA